MAPAPPQTSAIEVELLEDEVLEALLVLELPLPLLSAEALEPPPQAVSSMVAASMKAHSIVLTLTFLLPVPACCVS